MRTPSLTSLAAILSYAAVVATGCSSGASAVASNDVGADDAASDAATDGASGDDVAIPDVSPPEVSPCDPAAMASDPWNCGTCGHVCAYPHGAGTCVAGTCQLGSCQPGWTDANHAAADGCEVACTKTAPTTEVCDGLDNDCNGKVDDVDTCSDASCGACGVACGAVAHGNTTCKHTGTAAACDRTDTACAIAACDCTGPGSCWWDVDGSSSNGCEYACSKTNGGVEICDGLDNDCNGTVDDGLVDPKVGVGCQGGAKGECAAPAHAGTSVCVAGRVECRGSAVLTPGKSTETCNGLDDDCDGVVDDDLVDVGKPCGASATLPCRKGVTVCVAGAPVCKGNVDPVAETCNGLDDDCDGTVDDNLPAAQSGAPCGVPTPPPAGATSACKAGSTSCVSGAVTCVGSVGASGASDTCGVDANCDGALTSQPDLTTDVHNCGACGNDCLAGAVHAAWTCAAGACLFQGCQTGYYDNGGAGDAVAGDHKCGYPCSFHASTESCNGVDDNCDGRIDEGLVAPSPTQVCGVSASATRPECTTSVVVSCTGGAWKCAFPAGVCGTSCAATAETCDGLDNNCNGLLDENVAVLGQPCASDLGLPPPGDGVCRTLGTYVCNGPSAAKCSAVKDLTKAGPEVCDGIDNDCDGLVDEPFTTKGSNAAYFVKPAVAKIGASLWAYAYEASRPNATALTSGTGNGYVTSAPAATSLDKTVACSAPAKLPWYGVTPAEVDQTCAALGGHTCSTAEWQTGCMAKSATCTWGYSPSGSACTIGFVGGSKFCNLAVSYDFDATLIGMQSGLLPTASPLLTSCSADWTGVLGNASGADRLFDVTGNLREVTSIGSNRYALMGGAFDSWDEGSAACSFTYDVVDATWTSADTGFRCCFSTDPGL